MTLNGTYVLVCIAMKMDVWFRGTVSHADKRRQKTKEDKRSMFVNTSQHRTGTIHDLIMCETSLEISVLIK